MNKSERLLSAFAEMYFFKEFVLDDLCFTPEDSTKVELADLLLNLGDIVIAIQLKSRNEKEQTHDLSKENRWFENKCKKAKEQVKETLRFISSGILPTFKNKRGQDIILQTDAEVIPLVVFDNDAIKKYPHILRKHSENGMNINCMSYHDFQEMCRIIITPIEIIAYLKYRKDLYETHGDIDFMIFDGEGPHFLITKPTTNESLAHQFLTEEYGFKPRIKQQFYLRAFQDFLHSIPAHTIIKSEDNATYEVLLFLAHMSRIEIFAFMKRLIATKRCARIGRSGIIKSLRRTDDEYAIFFVAGNIIAADRLLPIVHKKAKVKKMLEVAVCWENWKNFRIDFVFLYNI